jgi:hypothetical protein
MNDRYIKSHSKKAIKLDPGTYWFEMGFDRVKHSIARVVGGSEGKAIRYSNELLKFSVDGYMSKRSYRRIL